ncbi:DNA ligase D [Bacillus sp. B15-48]|uniref:DNA ligase D n=1 Tax=Bacillus sp. B15-48 TaxID=1548601 RepID=UPI00193EEC87|nr:DNA ligase D [Bacillus sp. B15-48]MBM4761986.1 DNA ligase D [Bacillus sp. B15-48]
MKPMLPTLQFETPKGDDWHFEVKYDGFRAFLEWEEDIKLTSRNRKSLLEIFPEINEFLRLNEDRLKAYLPFILDGELVHLENAYKANFNAIQIRGRMRSLEKIKEKAKSIPCRLLIFDVLKLGGEDLTKKPYHERRKILETFFTQLNFPIFPDNRSAQLLQLVPSEKQLEKLWESIQLSDGEGIVAKQINSPWEEGKRTTQWIKIKNWKYVSCFITAYEKSNGYFYVGVFRQGETFPLGAVLFGFKPDEKTALFQIIKENHSHEDKRFIYVNPAICLEVKYLEMYKAQMREPHFHQFRFELKPEECTYNQFLQQQKNFPIEVEVTHPDKPIWENPLIKKMDLINYLREVAPFMLPFLKDRLLTVIRYPHGIFGEAFYQKNTPDYAPDFVETTFSEGINYIICNDLKTLLWLGNQIALEYHIPFQTRNNTHPDEIVFDLDPPSKDYFHLAIEAALIIKEVVDHLELISFIKTSGNKGLQVYIPLPKNKYTYNDTRLFTSFIADYLISKNPDAFTTERLKKHRGNRLYVDYIQHAEGKTIICPFSPRGTSQATVAAPLFWNEVNENLSISAFKVNNMISRLTEKGSPFADYFIAKDIQNFQPVLDFLRKKR